MNTKPNLFHYATSELSQDAFICWLLDWANPAYAKVDAELQACGVRFVQALLGKELDFQVDEVKVMRQWSNIDVKAVINNQYVLIIEDKTQTREHSDQLMRYLENAKEEYENEKILPIYFKMEEQGDYHKIYGAGYRVFGRKEMMEVLQEYRQTVPISDQNNVLADYLEYLEKLDEEINSYQTKPLKDWSWNAWKGFYSHLQKDIGGDWGYVPNASGGFLGFFWNFHALSYKGTDFKIYLQLEHERLAFKLNVSNSDNRREIREIYRNVLFGIAKEFEIPIVKFGRLGEYMGVAKLNEDFRKANENGILEFSQTVATLRELTELLNAVAERGEFEKGGKKKGGNAREQLILLTKICEKTSFSSINRQ